ncbi:uncharacterized protein LOC132607620 [Lycium barbarum]|uniref:uncharacterized protein LOC132607620 n=1 Tax=Lycium barbarum TaxID=112863 RepID=UPI00293E163D|nr:uncharacterized protein LOC132607620 [Lycium barbarum]
MVFSFGKLEATTLIHLPTRQPCRRGFSGLSGSESLDSRKRPLRHLLLIVLAGVTLDSALCASNCPVSSPKCTGSEGIRGIDICTPGFLCVMELLNEIELLMPCALQFTYAATVLSSIAFASFDLLLFELPSPSLVASALSSGLILYPL